MKFLISLIALNILLTGLVLSLGVGAFSFKPSTQDHDQAFAVAANINYPFKEYVPESASHPPSMYVKPGVKQTTLIIYGISNTQEQEKVLKLIKIAKLKTPDKAVQVRFMEKENWIQVTEAMRSRGHEKLLRAERIH